MPGAKVFLDSNVLLYALSDAEAEREKRDKAAELIATTDFGLSYQVLMEVWSVANGKMRKSVRPERVMAFLEKLTHFPCVSGTPELFLRALVLQRQHQLSPYDAAILAAAEEFGAGILYSEDFDHERVYHGIRAVNPFRK